MARTDCPFCPKNVDRHIIDQNDFAYVIFSNPRLIRGHLLVNPKRHVEKPWELSEEEFRSIFDLVFKYQKTLSEKIGVGCDIHQNYRPFMKQSRVKVDHVHYHLLPRTFKDEYYEKVQRHESDIFADLPSAEIADLMNLLAAKD